MPSKFDTQMGLVIGMGEILAVLAREMANAAKKKYDARKPKRRRGATLRPGNQTPLWNALISRAKPHLKKRGDRANLARELGVHRARIGEYFDSQSAMPDAERATGFDHLDRRTRKIKIPKNQAPLKVRITNKRI